MDYLDFSLPNYNDTGLLGLAGSVSLDNILNNSFKRAWHCNWYHALYFFLSCQVITIYWRYWWKAPSNIPIFAYPTPFGRWLMAWHLVYDSETILHKAYDKYKGKPFAMPNTERWVVYVSERETVRHFLQEPEHVLSTEIALHQLAWTDIILASQQMVPEQKGPKSESHRVVSSILKNKLRARIPDMNEDLRRCIHDAIALEAPRLHDYKHPDFNDWQTIRLMPALLRIHARINLFAFFNSELVNDPNIYHYTMAFLWSCACAFAVINLVPSWTLPLLGPAAMGFGITRRRFFDLLLHLTHRYQQDGGSGNDLKKRNIVQWTTETTKLRDAVEIAKIQLGLIFASSFQIPMITQACIDKLCRHPEYHKRLLSEAKESKDTKFSLNNQEMPYFDSLLRETARLCQGPIVTSPRTVMKLYTSPEGYRVPAGNWIAVPQLSLMQDERIWPRAKSFEPFRFVNQEENKSEVRFTHPSHEFPFWGSTHGACPARFYVSVIMKMLLAHVIGCYEIKLANPNTRPFISMGMVRVPNPFMKLLIRKRMPSGESQQLSGTVST